MADVWFYHLTEDLPEVALPRLIGQAMGRGWRIELRGRDRTRMERLDRDLWQGPDEAFLPHGLAGGPHDTLQPVLLTVAGQGMSGQALSEPVAANDPACLMVIDGADMAPQEAARLDRICVVFQGDQPDQLGRARDQWRQVTAAGIGAQYWAQESGRWIRKLDRPAAG